MYRIRKYSLYKHEIIHYCGLIKLENIYDKELGHNVIEFLLKCEKLIGS